MSGTLSPSTTPMSVLQLCMKALAGSLDHRIGPGCAQDRRRSPLAERLDALLDEGRQSGGVERVVGTSAGDPSDLVDRIGLRSVDRVGGAQFPGQLESGRNHVDCDDGGRAGDVGRHDRAEADGARAGDDEAGAGADAQRTQHRAGAGLDAAAQRAEQLQRRVVADLDGVGLVGDGEGGEGGLARRTGRSASRSSSASDRAWEPSGRWPAKLMSLKLAQLAGEPSRHGRHCRQGRKLRATWSPGTTFVDGAADRLHDPGPLMPEHDRQRHRVHLVPDDEVGVA